MHLSRIGESFPSKTRFLVTALDWRGRRTSRVTIAICWENRARVAVGFSRLQFCFANAANNNAARTTLPGADIRPRNNKGAVAMSQVSRHPMPHAEFTSKIQKLSIQYRAVKDLNPDPKNSRVHNKKQIRQIARSIEVFGFIVPILVDRDLKVIAGHGRRDACLLLGLEEVPAISLEHMSDAQIRAFMIADNRLTENATWDEKLLGEQLKSLSEVDLTFDLEITGFEMSEIDLFIEGLSPVDEAGSDSADELPDTNGKPMVTSEGDLWLLDRHRVGCRSALDLESY